MKRFHVAYIVASYSKVVIIVQKQVLFIDTAQCVSNLKSEPYQDIIASDIFKILHTYIFKASKRFYALSRNYYLWHSYFTIGPIQNISSKEPHDIWSYPCPGFII